MLLSISSIYMLWHQPRTPSRRVLLPYTIGMLAINTAFLVLVEINADLILQFYQDEIARKSFIGLDPDNEQFLSYCGKGAVSMQILRTLPVLFNDMLFVRSHHQALCGLLETDLLSKLFRAFYILGCSWKILAVPCVLYTGLVGKYGELCG
jgi:hypothetical protein